MTKKTYLEKGYLMVLAVCVLSIVFVLESVGQEGAVDYRQNIEVRAPSRARVRVVLLPPVLSGSFAGETHLVNVFLDTLKYDLEFSNIFTVLPTTTEHVMLDRQDQQAQGIHYSRWQEVGVDVVIKAELADGQSGPEIRLFSYWILLSKAPPGKRYPLPRSQSTGDYTRSLRLIVHDFSDDVVADFNDGQRGVAHTKLAFVNARQSEYGLIKEIYICDYDGHHPVRVTADENLCIAPAWSPDGRQIVYTSWREGNPDLFIFDWHQRRTFELSARPGLNDAAAWHPSGQFLAVTLSVDGNSEIYLLDVDGRAPRRLTNNHALDTSPAFSPNGEEIAFVSDRFGNPHIFVMDINGQNVRRVTSGGGLHDDPAWSPLGDRIAFTSSRARGWNIFVCSPDGSNLQNLTENLSGRSEQPAWSPDGKHIAFNYDNGSDGAQVYIMDADGSDFRRITYLSGENAMPAWGP